MHTTEAPADLRGEVLTETAEGYEEARGIFNDRLAGRPSAIVRCAGVADVRATLDWARSEGLEVSIRGGGHGPGGWAVNDGGVVIDLTAMRWVLVDAEARTAWIGGGARAGDVVTETVSHGLVPVTGVTTSVGLGGLATGAGEGYLTPLHGYASDNVLAFELVTAAGDVLRVSETERPDLYWALRGAGPNFGVVTAMQLRLHPVPEHVTGGAVSFGPDDVARATHNLWDLMEHGSPYSFPQAMYGPGDDGETTVSVLPGHVGPADVAEREIEGLLAGASSGRDDTVEMTYVELLQQLEQEPGEIEGFPTRHLWDCYHLPFEGPRTEQIDLVLSLLPALGPQVMLDLWPTRPGASAGPEGVMPRSPGVTLVVLGMWADARDDAHFAELVARIGERLRSSGLVQESPSGSNHVTVHDPARVRDLFGQEGYARLQGLKAEYDPTDVFRSCYHVPLVG